MKKFLTISVLALLVIGLMCSCDPNANSKAKLEYSITYKDAGGADFSGTHGANCPDNHTYGKKTTLVEPTKTGYLFGGWYITSDCSGDAVTTLKASDKYTEVITLYAKWTPILLSGTFTVDSSNKTVKFTRGNMYWDGDSFEIEKNQWDYQNYSATHVSHFYYSKDATVAYAESYDDSSKTTADILFTNGTETTTNSSFTVAGETGKYRNLSKYEWNYLLNTRAVNGGTGEGKSYQRAKVNSVNGLIIYPDGYMNQVTNSYRSDWYTAPTVTKENWAVMETAGCVFIPAAGARNGSSPHLVKNGFVWTASPYSEVDSSASAVSFNETRVEMSNNSGRSYGKPIRLVVDMQN